MTASSCHECGRALSMVSVDDVTRARESLGFGSANDRVREFCGVACKARWKDVDPVLEATRQATLAAFNGTARDDADRVAWGR